MLVTESIESLFQPFLQRNITINFNNKVVKSGKLLLVTLKNNYITLILSEMSTSPTDVKSYEIPYAFNYITDSDQQQLKLSYIIDDLCNDNQSLIDQINVLLTKTKKTHRFLNNILYINVVDQ